MDSPTLLCRAGLRSPEFKDAYRHMIALGTTDVRADYDRLKDSGIEFIEEPTDYGDGFWIATLKDPEGNVVQLFQSPI